MASALTNWAGTTRFTPAEIWRPPDERALMRRLGGHTGRVRAAGSLHSWSDAPATDDLCVRLDAFRGVRELDGDEVRVGAGTRLKDLAVTLAAGNMALPIVGSITEQTVAGAVSTGTHGSSILHGGLASLVTRVRLVDGRGELLELDENDVRFPGARLGLGALGILTELTLRCDRAFTLTETLEQVPFDHACADLVQLARSAEYVKLWWLPHTDRVLVFRHHRGVEGRARTELARQVEEVLLDGVIFAALVKLGALVPALVPSINRAILPLAFGPTTQHGPSDRMLTVAMPPRHFETESAIPLDRAGFALDGLRRLIDRAGHRVNFVQELRFAPPDDAWISGAYGRETCWFGTYLAGAWAGQTAARDRYFQDVWALLADHDPRPHWGKQLPEAPGLLRRYPRGEAFRALADTLDPRGIFRHGLVARAFS